MLNVTEAVIFWVIVATQVAGLLSLVVARLGERSVVVAMLHRAFFFCLFAVGAATVSAVYLHSSCWLLGAATLGIMAVGATLDCGAHRTAAPEF